MILMKSHKFRLFCITMIMLFPMSKGSADPRYTSGNYFNAGQYPGAITPMYSMHTPAVNHYAGRWRPVYPEATKASHKPSSLARYQGYKFRPWQQNYRYRPNFYQPHANYQAYQYRWRPLPHQAHYRSDAPGMREYPAGVNTVRASSWGGPGVMPQFPAYGHHYRSYPRNKRYVEYPGRPVYRSTNITIPNHYVFRPLRPRTQPHATDNPGGSAQQWRTKDYRVAPYQLPGKFSFRPLEVVKHSKENRHIGSDAPNTETRLMEARNRGIETPGKRSFNAPYFTPDRYPYSPITAYTPSQQYRRHLPSAGYHYPANMAVQSSRTSAWPGMRYRSVYPYNGFSQYPGYSNQQNHGYPGNSNAYNGVTGNHGSWYTSAETKDWPKVSQYEQWEYDYPSMDLAGKGY